MTPREEELFCALAYANGAIKSLQRLGDHATPAVCVSVLSEVQTRAEAALRPSLGLSSDVQEQAA